MQQAIALPLPRGARVPAYHEPVQIGSDEALARRAARGDEAAFEELVVRHQDKLYTLALRVTLSEADAYDCVQEGLIAAWRALPRFRGDARFSTWMYRIVVRKAYDAIDRRRRTPEPVEELHAVAPEAQPEARLDLIAALEGLEPGLPRRRRRLRHPRDVDGAGRRDAGAADGHGQVAPSPGPRAARPGPRAGQDGMTEHDHDEIARRLRESGTVPAPERLRAEVMDQVRAEPRLRPARRSFLTPAPPLRGRRGRARRARPRPLPPGRRSGSNGSSASGGGQRRRDGAVAGSRGRRARASPAARISAIFGIPHAALQKLALAPHVKAHASAARRGRPRRPVLRDSTSTGSGCARSRSARAAPTPSA